jgi:tetratricopeptide (TPR) repeat protein
MQAVDRALLLNPRAFEIYLMKGWACEVAGRPDAAMAAYRDAWRVNGAAEAVLQRVDAAFRADGLRGYYRSWLNRPASSASGSAPMSDTWRAQLYIRVGDFDHAIESLQHAYQKREGALAWVNVDPGFQPIRSDARFQQIAARVGHHE